jgi:RsiW-degrading membrane proteinase PrsW (M82 family)
LLLTLAIAPTVFLLLFVYLRDKYEREPLGLIAVTFLLGAIGVLPAALLELLLGGLFPLPVIVQAFLYVAVVEELTKFGAVRIKAYRSFHFNEVMDGIVYAVAASLGFATVENIIYVLRSGLTVAIFRAVLSVPDHAVWGGILGFYLGLAKRDEKASGSAQGQIFRGLAIVIILHGVYDSLAFLESLGGVILISVIGWVLFLILIRKALAQSPFRWRQTHAMPQSILGPTVDLNRPRFCSQCGLRLLGGERYCINCGATISN